MSSAQNFFSSKAGMLARYNARASKKLFLWIEGIEPRSKEKMPAADKTKFRQQVIAQMKSAQRMAFRGPVAVRIELSTSDKEPQHIQTIAKNLLDLLGRMKSNDDRSYRKSALYIDDSQVQSLSVSCAHGKKEPLILITAMPYRNFVADISLAAYVQRETDRFNDKLEEEFQFDDAMECFADFTRKEARYRAFMGDAYESLLNSARREAQERFLKNGEITLTDLAYLYGASNPKALNRQEPFPGSIYLEKLFNRSPLRITLHQLPTQRGQSTPYKREVRKSIVEFNQKFGWILKPLMSPIALEVVIKPPANASPSATHDLDNVVRDYLIGGILEELQPPSAYLFAVGRLAPANSTDHVWSDMLARRDELPRTTKIGLIRYEVLRLPRVSSDQADGFVCINLKVDLSGVEDLHRHADAVIEKWAQK